MIDNLTVDPLQMGEALEAVKKIELKIESKVKELILILCQSGVDLASEKVMLYDAIETGDLDSSIYYGISEDGYSGFIRADSDHAIYVEFGTGTCTTRGEYATHPLASKFKYRYDINGHGANGWFYFDKNREQVRWTKGMKSRPFMYQTALDLEDSIEKLSKGVFESD